MSRALGKNQPQTLSPTENNKQNGHKIHYPIKNIILQNKLNEIIDNFHMKKVTFFKDKPNQY